MTTLGGEKSMEGLRRRAARGMQCCTVQCFCRVLCGEIFHAEKRKRKMLKVGFSVCKIECVRERRARGKRERGRKRKQDGDGE